MKTIILILLTNISLYSAEFTSVEMKQAYLKVIGSAMVRMPGVTPSVITKYCSMNFEIDSTLQFPSEPLLRERLISEFKQYSQFLVQLGAKLEPSWMVPLEVGQDLDKLSTQEILILVRLNEGNRVGLLVQLGKRLN